MFIKIGGVRGVGKTTASRFLVNSLRREGYQAELVKGTALMAQVLGVAERDLARCTEEQRKLARKQAYDELYLKDQLNDPPTLFIRDGHFAIVEQGQNGQYITYTVEPRTEDQQQMRVICLLDAPLGEVMRRRVVDVSKPERNTSDDELLRIELMMERKVAMKQSVALGIPLYICDNTSPVQETVRDLMRWMQKDLGRELEKYRESSLREGRIQRYAMK